MAVNENKCEYEMCQDSKDQLVNSNTLLIVRRSKNKNVVLYQANLNEDGTYNESEPVKAFWLKIEPSYIEKRRKGGYTDDRQGLNFLERQMGYGFSVQKTSPNAWLITFVSLPSRAGVVTLDKQGKPVLYATTKEGKKAIITEWYVDATENFIGYPTVKSVAVTGKLLETGEDIKEVLTP